MVSDLNMPHGKMIDFVSFLLFGFTLDVKLKKQPIKNDARFDYVSWKNL